MKRPSQESQSSAGCAVVAATGSQLCSGETSRTKSGEARYRIVVVGHLDGHWSEWFDGLVVKQRPDGETALEGRVRDQSELYGHLIRLRDMGLTLVSVCRFET